MGAILLGYRSCTSEFDFDERDDFPKVAENKVNLPKNGKSVLIMGGDIKGLQLAEFLLKRGRKVTIVTDEPPDTWGEGLPNLNNYKLNVWFQQQNIEIIRSVQYEEITKKGLVITTQEGERKAIDADSIMPVFPLRSDEDLSASITDKAPEVYSIGACKNPKALIVDAISDASEIASSI